MDKFNMSGIQLAWPDPRVPEPNTQECFVFSIFTRTRFCWSSRWGGWWGWCNWSWLSWSSDWGWWWSRKGADINIHPCDIPTITVTVTAIRTRSFAGIIISIVSSHRSQLACLCGMKVMASIDSQLETPRWQSLGICLNAWSCLYIYLSCNQVTSSTTYTKAHMFSFNAIVYFERPLDESWTTFAPDAPSCVAISLQHSCWSHRTTPALHGADPFGFYICKGIRILANIYIYIQANNINPLIYKHHFFWIEVIYFMAKHWESGSSNISWIQSPCPGVAGWGSNTKSESLSPER